MCILLGCIFKRYSNYNIEIKKKVQIFVWLLVTFAFSLLFISLSLFIVNGDFSRSYTYLGGCVIAVALLVLLYFRFYELTVLVFTVVTTPLVYISTVIDPYGMVFEMYRLCMMLVSVYVLTGAISTKFRYLFMSNISGTFFLIMLYVTKRINVGGEWRGEVAFITIIVCVWMYNIVTLFFMLILKVFKEVINLSEQREIEVVKNNEKLLEFNIYVSKFIPIEFLQHLDKKDILDLKIGENVKKHMTIMFSDIRDFTSISEKLSPEENLVFINSYLSIVTPIIRRNNGFIDKYVGDGIIALFETSDFAVKAAATIIEEISEYNKKSEYNIRLGIGINSGDMILGTVGDDDRMDTTVISDAVNTASRLENLTKTFGADIIISESVYNGLSSNDLVLRSLGVVNVKGRQNSVGIFEVIVETDNPVNNRKLATIQDFNNAVSHIIEHRIKEAVDILSKLDKDDKAVEYYLNMAVADYIE